MQFKKSKTFLAALLATAMTCSALVPTAASAAGTRTKEEAYGDETYAARFMSLYDDVVTNGVANGYMSSTSTVSGGLGVPYHSIEELCIEAPDYGHETTSEALSYLVWVAAMRDNIVNDAINGEVTVANVKDASTESVGDLAKAWLTMESTMIPDVQNNFMSKGSSLSATFSSEWPQIEMYPTDMKMDKTATNPIHNYFCSVYGSDDGLYLMHWLADVDDWYGFGAANGSSYKQENVSGNFTLINTFQRGEQESCWETIPHACVDVHNKGYGIKGNGGMKGFFNTDQAPGEQWSYTNAPDAEDRAIQAVYAANRWGVGDQTVNSKWGGVQSLTELAAKMGDETRNNMYDKYYQAIGVGARATSSQNASNYGVSWTNANDPNVGKHYLMNWYTSWGGGLTQDWAWQIGASHCHQFYQNPLAAYALAYDTDSDGGQGLSGNMLAQNAAEDFQVSLERQMEFYLWLLSADGPIAGGATNSYTTNGGSYTGYSDLDISTFYDMAYVEHPVYADPGSNHWIGNQVWSMQRLAELYYVVQGTDDANMQIAQTGLTLSEALEKILDRWVGWFIDNTILGVAQETYEYTDYYEPYDTETTTWTLPVLDSVVDDGESFSIPSSLIWDGQPETWTGTYQENSNLTCTIVGYGDGDLGCVSSLANTLIYYAKAKGVQGSDLADAETSYQNRTSAAETSSEDLAKQSLYLAKELLDREWNAFRDDLGLGVSDHNTNLNRLWETKLVLPNGTYTNGDGQTITDVSRYSGSMPNGDEIKDGVAFVDIRSNYENSEMYQTALDYYNGNGEDVDGNGSVGVEDYYFTLHRFWHAGDIMMALGAMYELYPEVTPDSSVEEDELVLTPSEIELEVGESETIVPTVNGTEVDGCTFESADTSVATVDENGNVTGVSEGETTITVTTPDGLTATATVTVTDVTTSTTTDVTTTSDSDETSDSTTEYEGEGLLGDVNLDGNVNMSDSVLLNKYAVNAVDFVDQQKKNGNCFNDGTDTIDGNDAMSLLKFQVQILSSLPETP